MEIQNIQLDVIDPFAGILANAAFALRATAPSTLNASPAQMVFGRNMILHTTNTAPWHILRQRQQRRMILDNERANQHGIPHVYTVGDRVLIRNNDIHAKLSNPYYGPFTIVRLTPNTGIVVIDRSGYDESISISRLIPYAFYSLLPWGRMSHTDIYIFLYVGMGLVK
jgi:hypothetical protein